MSFLTAVPQELAAAAAQLAAIGSALAAQNAGAATPTTAIAPAAADQVSILQSSIFTAYGALYQEVSAQAQAIQEQFVQTLGLSSGTYEQSESANAAASALSAAASAAPGDPVSTAIDNLATLLGGPVTSFGGQPFSLSGNSANVGSFEIGNFASASSNMLGLTSGGLMPEGYGVPEDLADAAAAASAATPAATAGAVGAAGGGPISAAIGGSTLVGSMSVPPSWAAGTTLVSSTAPSALAGAGWTSAAPAATTGGGFYPGVPGMASAARNSAGFGAPRYGVKPIVMPKPAVAG
jgi:hypothetical protein